MSHLMVNEYLRKKYGRKIYKLPINAGFSCPNRDGTCGTGGCIFCSGAGSGDFAYDPSVPIGEQIRLSKAKAAEKGAEGYIAYFQAFTNTYAPVETLKKRYSEAMEDPEIVGISVATRPDCLPPETVRLLSEMNRIKPVWVELGLQTIHEKTAEYIRRGYPLSVYDKAVKDLERAGLYVITHVILGLPFETREQMLETVKYVGNSGVWGIKLQLLHVIRGTDLEKEYLAGKFETMSFEESISLVRDCVAVLPEDVVIHRLTGDGAKKTLVSPLWSADKKRVLNALKKELNGLLTI
ncbi:MAG: TIGR01212 family radical SAM protein [Lachnospiraceae bacterium]|nr:TIGR01212 family radical SAM protein [Lachnospiraceae bacterium]